MRRMGGEGEEGAQPNMLFGGGGARGDQSMPSC